jgi:hypothetical protein
MARVANSTVTGFSAQNGRQQQVRFVTLTEPKRGKNAG